MSSAMSPLPREMSSSASSLLPIAEAPVTSTPISSTSRNTPCSVVDSASTRDRKRRNTSTRCGDGWTDVKSAMWLASHFAARCGGTASPLATMIATSSSVKSRSIEASSSASGNALR